MIPAFEPPKSPDTVAGSHVIINHVRQGVSLLNSKTSGNVLSSVTHKCAVSCLRACHYDTSNWFHAEEINGTKHDAQCQWNELGKYPCRNER